MNLRPLIFSSLLAVLVSFPTALQSQVETNGFVYFPTGDVTDGRMVSLGSLNAFDRPTSVSIAVPASETTFVLRIFDGDTGGVDTLLRGHWDAGLDQLLYRLYFDPQGSRNTEPQNLVAEWTGNDPNPLTNNKPDPDRQWLLDRATMPDNGFWNAAIQTSNLALTNDGSFYSYHLVVLTDPAIPVPTTAASDFKIGVEVPATLVMNDFGFEASLRQIINDAPIIYPEFQLPPPNPRFFLETPTTFDGTFDFSFEVGVEQVELSVFDGDLDHGTDALVAFPSLASLEACADTDDADTPANYATFPQFMNMVGSRPEGASFSGLPSDDNQLDLFRRGEEGSLERAGCIRYEVIDPNGVVYRNDNPSGNLEWEQFRITTHLAANPDVADYGPSVAADGETFVTTSFLPEGTWRVHIVGLDLANINYWSMRTEPWTPKAPRR